MKSLPIRSGLWTAVACAVIFSSGGLALGHHLGPAATIPMYMLITLVVAWRAGFRASIAVAICATLGLDFFFTEPRFSLRVASVQDIFALTSFAAVSILVSQLSDRIRSNSDKLRSAEEQQRALYELSRGALLVDWKFPVGKQMCNLVLEKLHLTGVSMWDDREGSFSWAGDAASTSESLHASFRATRNYDLLSRAETIRLLRFGVRPVGAILFRGVLEPFTADAIATLIATHLERVRALKAEITAESQAVSERLRTAVLDGLAHAIKTPLTTIVVSSSGLREVGSLSPLQNELAEVIETQASYLATLTDKLLRTSKLGNIDVLVQPRSMDLRGLVKSALVELRTEYDTSRVHDGIPEGMIDLDVDSDLLRMAFVQVLENAFKYSPDTSDISLNAMLTAGGVEISVSNAGSFIAPSERTLIFERYYRSRSTEHRAPGTGIGLSVAKRAVEAHQGRIWVESDLDTGTTFHILLPFKGSADASRIDTHR